MSRRKPVVGEKLYVVTRTTNITKETSYNAVTRVGRTYFELAGLGTASRPCHFLISTWQQAKGYTHVRHTVYENVAEYQEQNEERKLLYWWHNFRPHAYPDVTHDKMRKIREILEAPADA